MSNLERIVMLIGVLCVVVSALMSALGEDTGEEPPITDPSGKVDGNGDYIGRDDL